MRLRRGVGEKMIDNYPDHGIGPDHPHPDFKEQTGIGILLIIPLLAFASVVLVTAGWLLSELQKPFLLQKIALILDVFVAGFFISKIIIKFLKKKEK